MGGGPFVREEALPAVGLGDEEVSMLAEPTPELAVRTVIAAASEPDVRQDFDDVVAVAFTRPFFAVGARPVALDAGGLWTCGGARGWTAHPSP